MKRVCLEFFIARYGLQKNVKQPLRYGVRTQPLLCAVSNKKISNGLEKNDLKAGVTVKDLSIKTWSGAKFWLSDYFLLIHKIFTAGDRTESLVVTAGWRLICRLSLTGCADWGFASWGKDGPNTFQISQNVRTERCGPVDVYRPRQGDELLEEKAQRRIINRWLSLIRNRCL